MSEIPEALVTVFRPRDAELIAELWPDWTDEIATDCERLEARCKPGELVKARARFRAVFAEALTERYTRPPDWRGEIPRDPSAEPVTSVAGLLAQIGAGPARTPPAPPAAPRPAVPKSPAEAGDALPPPATLKRPAAGIRRRSLSIAEVKALDAWALAPEAERRRHIEAVETEIRHADPAATLDRAVVEQAACVRWLAEQQRESGAVPRAVVGAGAAA